MSRVSPLKQPPRDFRSEHGPPLAPRRRDAGPVAGAAALRRPRRRHRRAGVHLLARPAEDAEARTRRGAHGGDGADARLVRLCLP